MLKLYNTLTRKKEEFVPLKKGTVKMYSCGPTVYNYAHIGNMRAYIFMDTLRKVLKYNGYKVKHVMNITDVGHLVSDADEGEDKMAKTARIENRSVYEIAKEYTDAFMKDIKALNIDTPEHIAKATEHIREMEIYVNDIVKNGYAYETSKGVYFDTSKLPNYGKMLSNNNIDDLKAGARVEVDTEKRNPQDFALWIKAPKEHIMKWNSKWGLCYPGWHIECSAMSRKYLGDKFDIHTGGVDHIPIHHENEIAQSIGATGHNLANYWMHVEFLLIDGGKMSKSLGNVYTLNDLKAKGIDALSYRYFTYSSHYRNKLNFTWDAIKSAKNSLNKLRDMIALHKDVNKKIDKNIISKYEEQFLDAINDDMNMPVAISIVWEIAKEKEKSNDFYELIKKFDSVLSLDLDKNDKEDINIPEDIKLILNERKDARENKNFAKSDELRDKLKELGYIVKDTKDGQIIEKV
ncbi:cysteine--tRNA ligase [Clostridium sp. CAG:465]|nr:cysteine--tRNA ligase [Clostridium sp. CAG:465]